MKSYYRYLPRLASYPDGYKMSKSGVYMRETVIDVAEVENMFVTPRSFMYYMNRLSGEEWKAEQEKDRNAHPPVTLEVIEQGIGLQTLDRMLTNENGRSNYKAMSDIGLCKIVDKQLVPATGRASVYEMTPAEVSAAIRYLRQTYQVSEAQLSRCFPLYSSLQYPGECCP